MIRTVRALAAVLLALVPAAAGAIELPDTARESQRYASEIKRGAQPSAAVPELLVQAQDLIKANKWDDALQTLESAAALAPDDYQAWYWLARSWLAVKPKSPNALASAFAAYRLGTDNERKAAALAVLGSALAEGGRYVEAMTAFDEGLAFKNLKARQPLEMALEKYRFQATGVNVIADADRPEICIEYRRPLETGRSAHVEDYVTVTPKLQSVARARGRSLCVDGVQHGQSYTVAVKEGLPAADGTRTRAAESFQGKVGDRTPSVAFKGGTYVLPQIGSLGVPLVTVNVEAVHLKIFRINERNLVHELNNERFARLLDQYSATMLADNEGRLVWQGDMEVSGERNVRATTSFDIAAAIKEPKPGIYILVAEPAAHEMKEWEARATQWLLISDIGLTTFRGVDGLTVFTRSLAAGSPMPGAKLRLIARNNDTLGEISADSQGQARFAAGLLRGEGGRRPKALYVETGEGDFTFLDLDATPFDLSDRGVSGRAAPGPLDVFLYTERGVYRRGETARVVALLRDAAAVAVDGVPLTIKVLRPDGVEAQRMLAAARGPGIFTIDVPFSETSRTGAWSVQAHVDPEQPPIGTVSVLVEDIIPPRIEVRIGGGAKFAVPGDKLSFEVSADYLYGAPAGGLASEAELVVLEDEAPYEGYAEYAFGLAEEQVRPVRTPVATELTNAAGKMRVTAPLSGLPDVTRPLKAVFRAGVFESGGRPATATLTVPVRQSELAIGVRPQFGKAAVPEGGEAAFDVVVLGRDGARKAAGLKYTLIREEWDYRWFLRDGTWDFEINVIDRTLGGGAVNATPEAPARVAVTTEWGRYRLEVYDQKSGAATSVRFRSGWFVAPTAGDTPDTLEVVADKSTYRPGDTVRLSVRAPFAGEALIVVANEGVLETRNLPLPAEGAKLELTFKDSWGVGAYVLATAFRPNAETRGPGRAIGLAWLALDAAPRMLAVRLEAPHQIKPRTRVDVPLKIAGLAAGEKAFVTLAAVDEGVLQLTRFATPDPAQHYFGKRRLAVAIRDLYGRLIDGKAGRRGHVRSGGGDPRLAVGAGAPPPDAAITALFSGVVELDAEGKATVPLEIPDYNGRLRLMAVASSEKGVGAGEAAMIVRDPVIMQASSPRFLAPGDISQVTVDLRNLDGAEGTYAVEIAFDHLVGLKGASRHEATLAQGGSTVAVFPVEAKDVGYSALKLRLVGPEGVLLERTRWLGIRPAQFPVHRRISKRMAPGESVSYSAKLLEEFRPSTTDVFLTFNVRPVLDVASIVRDLDRYPYGCLEQVTSRAMPLLYAADVATSWGGQGAEEAMRRNLPIAVRRVLELQRPDGGFALWSPAGDAEAWLSAYAMDFLARGRANHVTVPDVAFRNGISWLRRYVRESSSEQPADIAAKAYALYVLAVIGEGDAGEVRRFMEKFADKMPTALAAAQLSAALALHGEQDRARLMTGKAQPGKLKRVEVRDYGTPLRDTAGVIAVTAGASRVVAKLLRDWNGRTLENLVEDLSAGITRNHELSSQEMAWTVLAAESLSEPGKQMTLTVNGAAMQPRQEAFRVYTDGSALAKGATYSNTGTTPIWHMATVTGVPLADEPAGGEGLKVARSFLTLQGAPVDLAKVRQNDLLIALVEGEATTDLDHQALVTDLLPAGFEVENARLADRRDTSLFAWLPPLTETQHVEYRDDRYVAAVDIDKETRSFTLAYLVRAVTPGSYRLPAVHVEDMYKPRYRARSEMSTVTVLGR